MPGNPERDATAREGDETGPIMVVLDCDPDPFEVFG